MKRYYFDLYNSDGLVADETGQFFESRDRARAEALRILHDVARDEMPDRDLVKITSKCAMKLEQRRSKRRSRSTPLGAADDAINAWARGRDGIV